MFNVVVVLVNSIICSVDVERKVYFSLVLFLKVISNYPYSLN